MNKVQKLDRLRANKNLEIYNLVACDYTVEVVQHWMKYHWAYLEANHERNPDLHAVWIDLTSAVSSLEPDNQQIIQQYCEGYALKEIAAAFHRPMSGSILQQQIHRVVRILNGGVLREDS